MKKTAIYERPQVEVMTLCESEMLCTSIMDGGSALGNDVTDGDVRMYDSIEEFAIFGLKQ